MAVTQALSANVTDRAAVARLDHQRVAIDLLDSPADVPAAPLRQHRGTDVAAIMGASGPELTMISSHPPKTPSS
jgi:hypothetical protein